MRYLLDTHILLWLAADPDKLSRKILAILNDDRSEILASIASIWEMGIKISLKKLSLGVELNAFVDDQILNNGISLLAIKKEHVYQVLKLPFHHRDPFDRLLAAQVQCEGLTFLTADKVFKKYDLKSVY